MIAFALGLRDWRLLLGLAIPVLAFLGLYGAFFLPSLSALLREMGAIATQHYAQKSEEVEHIQQELQQTGDSFLLLCDCNLVDISQAYQQFSSFAQDSFREAGWGFGHTKLVQVGTFSAAVGQQLDFI